MCASFLGSINSARQDTFIDPRAPICCTPPPPWRYLAQSPHSPPAISDRRQAVPTEYCDNIIIWGMMMMLTTIRVVLIPSLYNLNWHERFLCPALALSARLSPTKFLCGDRHSYDRCLAILYTI